MEAADEAGWKNDEEDLAYLNALNNDLSLRPMFCAFQPNFYAVGYGDAADVIGKQSRRASRAYAAVALIGTSGLDSAEAEELAGTETRVPGVMCADVQWPVWLVYEKQNENTERMVSYYRRANHSQKNGVKGRFGTTWLPQVGGTVDEHWCANVIADQLAWTECVNRDYSEAILSELFDGIYRYPGNNNGALRRAENIYERGFKKYTADIWGGYYTDHRDTYRREWYVYRPESAPADQPVPAVFVFHGAGVQMYI